VRVELAGANQSDYLTRGEPGCVGFGH
jgi:hypothetical protein